MAGGGKGGPIELEYTPTWIVASVCSVIVFISLLVERLLHHIGKILQRKNQKPLFEALQKVKEELMLLGFISLLLTVSQGMIQRICILEGWTNNMLPCKKADAFLSGGRRLLSEEGSRSFQCIKGKVPLLSLEAIDKLHIFIFVLAITHVIFSVLTMLLGGAKIRQWKPWEDSIQKEIPEDVSNKITHVHDSEFIKDRFKGIGTDSQIISWLHSFAKQFYASVTKSDYTTMRFGFIMTHCKTNQKFDFHKYMIRALEADFKKVVGIRWYLWVFVVVFMLLNVDGLHAYFWLEFIPLILLLAVGTKLEHVFTQLAHEVAEKHTAIEGDLVVKPSDDHFWFNRPRIVLYLIHFILFQNAFEIAFFFWILTSYGFNSCIMGQVYFIVPRLVLGLIIQLLCSYSTLPLYAIVTQMGSSFKGAIFEEHVQVGLVGWANKAKKRKAQRALDHGLRTGLSSVISRGRTSMGIQLQRLVGERESLMDEGKAVDVVVEVEETDSDNLLHHQTIP